MTDDTSPRAIWLNGRIVSWSEATVHLTSETAMRGTNVFEGIRGYWNDRERLFSIVAMTDHLTRLEQSARILGLPMSHSTTTLAKGIEDLISAFRFEGDIYVRPTVYLDKGDYRAPQDELIVGAFIAVRPAGPHIERSISCIVSTWQRIGDLSLPPIAKIGASYTAFRLARMEAASAGVDEAILLNSKGCIAETGGAAVFVVKNGHVSTPPISDGVLDSITRRIAINLLSTDFRISVAERSIPRSELYVADEIFICGTLDEIRPVASVDHRPLPQTSGIITVALRNRYRDLCLGLTPRAAIPWLHDVVPEWR